MKKPEDPRVTYKIDADEHLELWIFATYRHVGGQYPINSFAKEAAFAYMKKYPVPEAEKAKLTAKYRETFSDSQAAQPEGSGEARSDS
jgi:hypothetical protein